MGKTYVVEPLRTARGIIVPDAAISVRFARSGGPGGQHVNTASSKVHLSIDLASCEMPEAIRSRLERSFGDHLTVTCEESRSQWRNRQLAQARAMAALDAAAAPATRRVATKPKRSATRKRLEEKARRSETKRLRQVRIDD
ncbi:MAG: alternative ribosome rescue aminoacyl-tRNA hydrolase ArfB [Actinomycetes bacterium]